MLTDDIPFALGAAMTGGGHIAATASAGDATDTPDTSRLLRYRTVWISGLHLGTPGCQARALLDFLKHVECEPLYPVGDINCGAAGIGRRRTPTWCRRSCAGRARARG